MIYSQQARAGFAVFLAAVLACGGVAAHRAVPLRAATPLSAAGTADDFFAAAALQPSDLPGSLQPTEQGDLTAGQIAAQGGEGVADLLDSSGFQQGYQQGFEAANRGAVLAGATAGVGDLLTVFSSADGASAWKAYEQQNAAGVGQQAAASAGVSLTLTDTTPIDLPALGDESSAEELSGTATVAGLPLPVVVDIAFVRRGVVQYTVVAAGVASQQDLLQQIATTLDAKVAAALPLLAS
ncbi:MAG TPA: hypothetical protein VKV26_01850 [Dehalococcoidia bacterium]|nr:hypothetical protein [Dehalococcoidia bacterium]